MSAVKSLIKDTFLIVSLVLLVLIYTVLYLNGIYVINIDWHWQFIDKTHLYSEFWPSVWYFHANPPGISIFHYIADKVSFGHKYIFFEVLFPLLHFISLLLFYRVLQFINIKYCKIITFVLFFNPLLFIYFKYPFNSTIIFVSSCLLLFILFSPSLSKNRKLIFITLVLSLNSFTRASWHVFVIALFLIPFWYTVARKYVIGSLLLFAIPLGVYWKNYFLFGKFTSSSWSGFNFARIHIPEKAPHKTISNIYVFTYGSSVTPLRQYVDPNNPLLRKYSSVSILNQDDLNNITVIPLSDLYMQDVVRNFQLKNSLREVFKGFFQFLDSPGDYFVLHGSGLVKPAGERYLFWFAHDIFDLPGVFELKILGKTLELKLSLYMIVYPLAFVLLLLSFRQLTFEHWFVLVVAVFFSTLYFSLDPLESNRMRFEIEPLLYFLTVLSLKVISEVKLKPTAGLRQLNNHNHPR